MANWIKRFMKLTKHIATWSKDKSIGTCAVAWYDSEQGWDIPKRAKAYKKWLKKVTLTVIPNHQS